MVATHHTMNHELDVVFKIKYEVTIWPYPNGSHSGTCAPIVVSVPVFVEKVFLLPTFEQEHVCTISIVSEEIKRARIVVVVQPLNHIAHSVISRVCIIVFISVFHD